MGKVLVGDKIILTPTTEKDLDFICAFETDKNVWLYEDYVKKDKEATRKLFLDRMKDDVKVHDFIISRKHDKTNTPVGMAYIWSYNDYRNSWEIGYGIAPDYQQLGYGSESGGLLLKFGFKELKAHKIVAMCNSKNIGSGIIMQRIGMHREGIFREELFWHEKWTDQYFFSILEREFFNN